MSAPIHRAHTQVRPYGELAAMNDRDVRRRRSIRLKGYDYSRAGAYFVTICTQGREYIFGEIADGEMRLNGAGVMVGRWWNELNNKFPTIETDVSIVMPNHFHGIVIIVGADLRVRPDGTAPVETVGADLRVRPHSTGAHTGAPLHQIIQWFKTMTTNAYMRGVRESGWPPFAGRLWQRNYYEHVIRDDEDLAMIREYIVHNPLRWTEDRENPIHGNAAQSSDRAGTGVNPALTIGEIQNAR